MRETLRIPFNPGAAALRYEHSMGQGLPEFIHRAGNVRTAGPELPEPQALRSAS